MALKLVGAKSKRVPVTVSKTTDKKTTAKKSIGSRITKEDLAKCAKEYSEISAHMKALDERKKALAKIIKEASIRLGTKDDKGSSFCEVDGFITGNVSKVSMSLDQAKGVDYLEKKGLGDLVDVSTVKTINEDRLEKAVGEKRLTLDEVDSFTTKKVTYQVSVKAFEAMPTVEQSEFALAASKK